MQKILITGGAGYIASHTIIELLKKEYDIIIADNLSNSSKEAVKRVEAISGKNVRFYKLDTRNYIELKELFQKEKNIDGVIHFAALKAVGESVEKPLLYYENNVTGSLTLFRVMKEFSCKNIVFSSSATVYGDPEKIPCDENQPLQALNPYGSTKLMMEQILLDISKADSWNSMILRYFNPVGAHESGNIGEDPAYPNNLVPFVSQVAAGIREKVTVFGDDWDTPDGTGVRDYIHITDLAKAHVKALEMIPQLPGARIYNLGTGKGYSVLEIIKTFEKISGKKIPYTIGPRRNGDIAENYADCQKAEKELKWKAELDLNSMIQSAWNWQSKNPNGYRT